MVWKRCDTEDPREEAWVASRPMDDGACDYIYDIYGNAKDGYWATRCNNGWGENCVAVARINCKKESRFKSLEKLKKSIETKSVLWLYVSHCNCIGRISKEA